VDANQTADDLHEHLAGLSLPLQVAAIAYPHGCRIRRVRVRAIEPVQPASRDKRPLIVSRRALEEYRGDDRRSPRAP
jgi:hypothetical protein